MKIARRIPKASWRTAASGVTQCTVDDALEMIRCSGRRAPSLTPRTIVMSGASFGGASAITRRAPADRCASSSARVRLFEVASRTVSTPRSPHLGMPDSFPVKIGIERPAA